MMNNTTTQEILIDIDYDESSCVFCGHMAPDAEMSDQTANTQVMNISVSMKIYRSKLINEILNAHSNEEVKEIINENILRIKKQDTRENIFVQYIRYIIEELNDLKGSTLANEYYMNLSTAHIHLSHLSLSQ
jgi:dissimilatory sulfite reductase (desulfoviridin) alpha/beta subunit